MDALLGMLVHCVNNVMQKEKFGEKNIHNRFLIQSVACATAALLHKYSASYYIQQLFIYLLVSHSLAL